MVFFFLFFSKVLWADCSLPFLESQSPVYEQLEYLASCELLGDVIWTQRPFSRTQVLRLIEEAENNQKNGKGACDAASTQSLLSDLNQKFRTERAACKQQESMESKPIESAQVRFDFRNSQDRDMKFSDGTGSINGRVNPLTSHENGRVIPDRGIDIKSTHWTELPFYFSLYTSPGVTWNAVGEKQFYPYLNELYLRWAPSNFVVDIGKAEQLFGVTNRGGTLFSNHPQPMSQIRITSDRPYHLPLVGPTRSTLFLRDLGGAREYPHALAYGFLINIQPAQRLELGFGHSITLGGRNSPETKWVDWPLELVFLRRGAGSFLGSNAGKGGTIADHRASFTLRWQLPIPLNPNLLAELFIDDTEFDHLNSFISQRMGWFFGFHFPRLGNSYQDSLRIEWVGLPRYAYRHSSYTDGYTTERNPIGWPTGPGSRQYRVQWDHHFTSERFFSTSVIHEHYNGRQVQVDLGTYHEHELDSVPNEKRYRILFQYGDAIAEKMNARVFGGIDRINSFNFQNQHRLDYRLGISADYSF